MSVIVSECVRIYLFMYGSLWNWKYTFPSSIQYRICGGIHHPFLSTTSLKVLLKLSVLILISASTAWDWNSFFWAPKFPKILTNFLKFAFYKPKCLLISIAQAFIVSLNNASQDVTCTVTHNSSIIFVNKWSFESHASWILCKILICASERSREIKIFFNFMLFERYIQQ